MLWSVRFRSRCEVYFNICSNGILSFENDRIDICIPDDVYDKLASYIIPFNIKYFTHNFSCLELKYSYKTYYFDDSYPEIVNLINEISNLYDNHIKHVIKRIIFSNLNMNIKFINFVNSGKLIITNTSYSKIFDRMTELNFHINYHKIEHLTKIDTSNDNCISLQSQLEELNYELKDEFLAKRFLLIVSLTDGYFSLKEREICIESRKFFNIIKQLPIELQGLICNLTVNVNNFIIPSHLIKRYISFIFETYTYDL